MERNKKIALIVIYGLVFIAMACCFYATAFYDARIYASDLPHHVRVAQLLFNPEFYSLNFLPHIEGYLLFHIFIKGFSVFIGHNYELAASLLLAFANVATCLIVAKIANKLLKRKLRFIEHLIIIGSVFVIGLPLLGKFYLPQGTPNVWHNPTLTFSRPLGLICFWSFYEILEKSKLNKKYYFNLLVFSISAVLCCYAKPSFVFVFLPVAGCYTIYYLFKAKFKNIMLGILLFIAVIPTLLLLIYQYSLSFENNLTIILQFGTFLNLSLWDSFLATLAIALFPLSYIILFAKNLVFKKYLLMSWLTFGVGWLQYFFLTTKEVAYGDFCWGYFMSMFVLYSATIIELFGQEKSKKKHLILGLFGLQLILGIYFFITQWMMKGFWI